MKTEDVLNKLAQDKEERHSRVLPPTVEKQREQLSQDKKQITPKEVKNNPKTPKELLTLMAKE